SLDVIVPIGTSPGCGTGAPPGPGVGMRRDGVRRIVGTLKLSGVDPASPVIRFAPPPGVEVRPPPALRQPDRAWPHPKAADGAPPPPAGRLPCGPRPPQKAGGGAPALPPIHRVGLLGGESHWPKKKPFDYTPNPKGAGPGRGPKHKITKKAPHPAAPPRSQKK